MLLRTPIHQLKCHLIRTLQKELRKFSNKVTKTNHPNIIFNGSTAQRSAKQKHLGHIFDEKLTFNDHITSKLTTVNKLASTLRKLYHYMPRESLVTIVKDPT